MWLAPCVSIHGAQVVRYLVLPKSSIVNHASYWKQHLVCSVIGIAAGLAPQTDRLLISARWLQAGKIKQDKQSLFRSIC